MKKIIVPTDFSLNARVALDFAVHIAKQAGSEIILIHACELIDSVFKDSQALYKVHNKMISDRAMENLMILKNNIYDTQSLSVTVKLFKGKVSDTIIQAAEENRASLIVMGSGGEVGITGKVFGSKTSGIIGKTNVPLMVVPAGCEWQIPGKILLSVFELEGQRAMIEPVVELAKLFRASVHVTRFTDVDYAQEDDFRDHRKSLDAFREKLEIQFKDVEFISVHLGGKTYQNSIDKYIRSEGIDIVAMITYKRTFLESMYNPSMTRQMSARTKIPLIAIPA